MDVRFVLISVASVCVRLGSSSYHEQYRVPQMCTDMYETYIYENKQYVIENFPVPWGEAQILCRGKYNGSLAVLDSAEKAEFIAEALAESQFSALESVWVGSRRGSARDPLGYRWIGGSPLRRSADDFLQSEKTYERSEDWFPVWLNRSGMPRPAGGADCVAVDRVYHDRPVLLDLPCQLRRGFVCESGVTVSEPIVEQRAVRCRGGLYRVYLGWQSWHQAAAFCVSRQMKLANIYSSKCLRKLGMAMLRSRPSIESAWIGAHGEAGVWTWLDSGLDLLAPSPEETNWPPLRDRNLKPEGCLQLDRHNIQSPVFLEARCERKMRFICYDNTLETSARRKAAEEPPSDDNYYYILVRQRLTWQHAMDNCHRMNGTLAFVDSQDILIHLLLVMGENKEEPVSHSWLSGHRKVTREPQGDSSGDWVNPATGKKIPRNSNEANGTFVPPWLEDDDPSESACLNLDRQDHLTGLVYGVPCSTQQRSVCMIAKHPNRLAHSNKKQPTSARVDKKTSVTGNTDQPGRLVTDSPKSDRENSVVEVVTARELSNLSHLEKEIVRTEPTKMEEPSNNNEKEVNGNNEKDTTSHVMDIMVAATEYSREREPEKNNVDKVESIDKQENVEKNEAERPEAVDTFLS